MNEGAGRGIVLIAVAVLIGAVLLGQGLDDSVSTARSDSGSAPTETTQPTDDTSGDDAVASPVDPSSIVVLVANGSEVSGAAGAVTDQLAALGYQVLPATDATASTPLDTVYYATSPDTMAQAQQVASDLGLPDTSVLPYEGPEAALADMALAQVLVVLGSSPGMLATGAGTGDTVPTDTTLPG